jgi:alpha-galactosidase
MTKFALTFLCSTLLFTGVQADPASNQVWLDSLNLKKAEQSYGEARAGKSVESSPLTLAGKVYEHGVGTHSVGIMVIDLHGQALNFHAVAGVDDDVKAKGTVIFTVFVDQKKVLESQVLHGGGEPIPVTVDLKGAQKLLLVVGDAGDGNKYDHADWADASITLAPDSTQKPEMVSVSAAPPRLTIPAVDPKPAIHGARVVGSTPGRPFLFPVGATGTTPLTYAAENLPEGLQIDAGTGVISGSLAKEGTTKVTLTVKNSVGTASRELTIVGGANKLALTPPMGWNSWNVWGKTVDEGKIRDAGREMMDAGLVAHGYQYVNIDDGWQGKRDAKGTILPNKKFADMKALCDDLHAKGIKAGIYSSPGPQTCGGFEGSYKHEEQDAQTYAQWGFDFLKYDLCTYSWITKGDNSAKAVRPAYAKMATALAASNRDILYSLCEYGDGKVWEWGAEPDIHGNSWRTGTDIDDVWTGSSGWGSDRGVYNILEKEVGHETFAGPGHWNDPDMLMVGVVGFGHPHPTELTPNEQITHVSMWCMVASPLLIGCDMTKFDPFTIAILTNDELIDINQDPLGHAAGRVAKTPEGCEVWSRELSDGTHAVALLNPLPFEHEVTVKWSDIGVTGKQPVRDLWLHQDVGSFDDAYTVTVPMHGTVVIKVGQPNPVGLVGEAHGP